MGQEKKEKESGNERDINRNNYDSGNVIINPLNQQQTQLLIEVSKQKGTIPALRLGRKVYLTAVSGYNNLIYLKNLGFIDIFRKHNANVAIITSLGKEYLLELSKHL